MPGYGSPGIKRYILFISIKKPSFKGPKLVELLSFGRLTCNLVTNHHACFSLVVRRCEGTCTGDDDVIECCVLSFLNMTTHVASKTVKSDRFKVTYPLYCIVYYSNRRSSHPWINGKRQLQSNQTRSVKCYGSRPSWAVP